MPKHSFKALNFRLSANPHMTIDTLQIELQGGDAIPFTQQKQQSFIVATVSYLGALNITAAQLTVVGKAPLPFLYPYLMVQIQRFLV